MEIQGLDDCLKWMDNAPANCLKASRTAMKAASRKTSGRIRSKLPKRWRRLVKSRVEKRFDGNLSALIGLFNGHQMQGHQNPGAAKGIDDWFKAYWANYGTLTHRDPQHSFREPVKHGGTAAAKNRRNNVGQEAQHFFEDAAKGFEDVFTEAFSESLAKQERVFYER